MKSINEHLWRVHFVVQLVRITAWSKTTKTEFYICSVLLALHTLMDYHKSKKSKHKLEKFRRRDILEGHIDLFIHPYYFLFI